MAPSGSPPWPGAWRLDLRLAAFPGEVLWESPVITVQAGRRATLPDADLQARIGRLSLVLTDADGRGLPALAGTVGSREFRTDRSGRVELLVPVRAVPVRVAGPAGEVRFQAGPGKRVRRIGEREVQRGRGRER